MVDRCTNEHDAMSESSVSYRRPRRTTRRCDRSQSPSPSRSRSHSRDRRRIRRRSCSRPYSHRHSDRYKHSQTQHRDDREYADMMPFGHFKFSCECGKLYEMIGPKCRRWIDDKKAQSLPAQPQLSLFSFATSPSAQPLPSLFSSFYTAPSARPQPSLFSGFETALPRAPPPSPQTTTESSETSVTTSSPSCDSV